VKSRLILLLALALAQSGCLLYSPIDLGALAGPGELRETVVRGTSGPKIAMLDISGVIAESQERSPFGFGERPGMVAETKNALERAADDHDVAALLLRIDSPGGSVSASDTLYHEVAAWKAKTKKPVFAFINGLGASGAYYLAMAADRVIAHPAAVTGSIGVIMPGISFEGLMTKYGVADQTIVSGPFKDTGSMFRDMRSDERAQLQSVINDLYGRFTEIVAKGRPNLDPARVRALADGRVYSSQQALAAGLVDELGYLEDAITGLEQRAGIQESRVVVYHRANQTRENIYSRAPTAAAQTSELSLVPLRLRELAPGFYYLWPLAFAP
jgi:protease-4